MAKDSTSNNNDGTLGADSSASSDDPTWISEDLCVSGKCLQFDGSDDVVNLTNSSSISPSSGSFTVSTWFKSTNTGTAQYLYWDSVTTTNQPSVQLYIGSDNKLAGIYRDTENDQVTVTGQGNTVAGDNKWHYASWVRDGTTGRMYLDGVLIGTNTNSSLGTLDVSTGRIPRIGGAATSDPETLSAPMKGFMDEVKVYNYARSADQIHTDYNSRSSQTGSSAQIGNQSAKILSDGLVGYWKIDETSGNATDSSGNGYTLTNTNTVTYSAGKFGNASVFAAASSQRFENTTFLDTINNSPTTISLWFKPTTTFDSSATTDQSLMAKENINDQDRILIYLEESDGSLQVKKEYNDGGLITLTSSQTSWTGGTWYHVAVKMGPGGFKLYINGAEVDSDTSDENSMTSGTDRQFQIGADWSVTPAYFFSGTVDEFRVYNRALSPAEISQLYEWAPGPKVQLKMEEGSGTSANDSSGNSNTGTVNTGTWTTGKYGKGVNIDGTSGSNVSISDFAY